MDLLRDGHDQLAAALLWRKENSDEWRQEPLRLHSNDRWRGRFTPPDPGRYLFEIEVWTDQFGTLRRDLLLKQEAGQDVELEAREARELLSELTPRAIGLKRRIERVCREFDRTSDLNLLLSAELAEAVASCDLRGDKTRSVSDSCGHRPAARPRRSLV